MNFSIASWKTALQPSKLYRQRGIQMTILPNQLKILGGLKGSPTI